MKPRFWIDLDNTLISGTQEGDERVIVYRRPGARKFLAKLKELGSLGLCTHGVREHARNALRVTELAGYFDKVLTREDLDRVQPGKGPRLGEPGYMFDDYPVGSWLYDLKATALGIGPALWITVEKFGPDSPDRDGLRKAYMEFIRRVKASA